MKNNSPSQFKSLAKKISLVEIVILLTLILMWISTFYLMHTQRIKHVVKMVSLQEKILNLAQDQLRAGATASDISWPFNGVFAYMIIEDSEIIATDVEGLNGKNLSIKEAFGTYMNASEMMKQLRINSDGTDWIRLDKLSPKQWLSWRIMEGTPYTIAIISDEDALLDIAGYHGYRLLLLICACLFSALLLLALIWALSWLRLSAVKDLLKNS